MSLHVTKIHCLTGEFHGKFHEEKKTILHESMNVKLRKIVSRCSLLLLRIAYLSAMKQRPLKLLVTQDTVSASTRSVVNEKIYFSTKLEVNKTYYNRRLQSLYLKSAV